MKLQFAENMDQVLSIALERPLPQLEVAEHTEQAIAPVPPPVTPPGDAPTAHQ
jgi:hypothetical protein